jgi:hypothetical protein
MNDPTVDWFLVNQLVPKEHQYLDAEEPPLDSVRMAWPFKTEEELKVLSKWFKKQERNTKQKEIEQLGEALL